MNNKFKGNKLVNSRNMTAEQKFAQKKNDKLKAIEIVSHYLQSKIIAVSSFEDILEAYDKVEKYLHLEESKIKAPF